ncbi:MAG: aldehyde dehydrogenase family protein, partial [Burkholderiales bacterium]
AQALAEVGLPEGVVNVVFGAPEAVARRLLASPVIRLLTFTGATSVGRQLGAAAAQSLKKAVLELGGHAPVLVAADADPVAVARGGVLAKYRSAGQICTSPTRFYVHRSIHAQFVDAFVAATEALVVGDPFDPATQMGPLQNADRVAAMQRMVADCESRGVAPKTGGKPLEGPGHFFAPTVIAEPPPDCLAMNEEPFGPLALLAPVDSLEQGIAAANRLPYGLAAYGFTHELATAERLSSQIEAGNVSINHWVVSWAETPFGGMRDSGLGYEGGIEGIQAFQRLKFVSQAS